MRKIANILTKNLFNDELFYNVVDSKDKLINGLPVLCVGIELTKKNYPNFNILDMNVSDDIYWTYGPREKRNIYETRLKTFIYKAFNKFKSDIHYKYVNVIVDGLSSNDFTNLTDLIFNGQKSIYSFISNGIVYVYNNSNIVYGISLRELNYIGENSNFFLSSIYNNVNVIMNNNNIPLDIRILFKESNYLIPCLYSNNNII